MAASKTVGDGAGGVDAVTMTAKVGAGVMACASGAVGEAASGEDIQWLLVRHSGTLFMAKEVMPAEEVVLQMRVVWVVPGLPQKMQKARASGWVWKMLPESWQHGPSLVVS